ncbi:hypothetical protein KIPB_009098 [Kipferlia bialata]|uniref:Uncharacterized protein n=1 Tax=Kipferlia bialata TaxID=797122 RepID=A0A391NNZ2_9EUKA|nr:hypothetical protein KIPB_009098 [Kipferlia bialata]|eukprot:g9098.t1
MHRFDCLPQYPDTSLLWAQGSYDQMQMGYVHWSERHLARRLGRQRQEQMEFADEYELEYSTDTESVTDTDTDTDTNEDGI